MKKILPVQVAVRGTLVILSLVILFHILVIAGVVPPDIVWGGNLADQKQLYLMEAVSVIVNGIMLFVILSYAGIVRTGISPKFLVGTIWVMFVLFVLNTIGNLLAKQSLETYLFTPLTMLLAVFCFRMATFDRRPGNKR